VDKQSSYENKLGPDGARAVFHRISSAGERAGIKFSFGGRTGNTLDSHRLLEYAARQDDKAEANDHKSTGLQTRLAEELFADYFEREQDITSHTVLRRAAVRAGIASSEGDIERFLASNDLVDEVQKAAAAQREEGVSGIPYFVINDEFAVEGAQEPIAFLHLFERLVKRGRMGPSL
jgi:predicted DsbA family dithiol-disulfide isomerase